MNERSVARKHHYIPLGYLAAFTDSGTKDGQFYVLDVGSRKAFRTSPSNVAAERDFNRVDIEGHSPDAVENSLAPFEGEAVAAIRRVIKTRTYPSNNDWNYILNLIALLAVRTPRFRKSFNRSRKQALRIRLDLLVSDEKIWEKHVQKAKEAGEDFPDASFEKFKSFIERGEFDFKFHPQENLRSEFNAQDKVLSLFGQRDWSVLLAPENGPEFICSDHPVTLVWKKARNGPIGYGLRGTEVFFPLGPKVGFYGVYESPLKKLVNCHPRNIGIMNMRLCNGAEHHVYSTHENFVIWYKGHLCNVSCNPTKDR